MNTRQYVSTADVLSRYAGRPVYLHEVSGNNGDELILRGSQFLLQQHGCVQVPTPEEADVLLINGGFKSDFWPFANETIRTYSNDHPDKPLVILPSSYLFDDTDFPALFAGRNAPVTIMARELPSLELVEAMSFPCDVEYGLDHDTAFALAEDREFVLLAKSPTYRDLLIVERGDAESVSGLSEAGLLNSSTLRSIAAFALPRPALSLAARVVGHARRRGADEAITPFAQEAVSLGTEFLGHAPDTLLATDVSRRSVCTFPEFCNEIAHSEVIVSTRLHVAILGAILGRRTYIVAGKYHKIPGIYEYSMATMDHVSMVSPHCELVA